jgi:hypothetical protein
MDACALIMNAAKIENVQAAIQCTKDYGVYDDSGYETMTLENIKKVTRPAPGLQPFVQHRRGPGTCIPWLSKKEDFPDDIADEALVKSVWDDIDAQASAFCWTNLTW